MKSGTNSLARAASLALLCAGLALAGCGGGGSSSSSRAFLTGTVATGNPLLGAEVTVKDRRGVAVTTKTSAVDGRYTISVKGLVPPFLVRADDGSKDGLFGVGWQAGVVNVDPLTHLLVHLYYQAHQLDAKTVFDELSTGLPMPTRAAVLSIGDQIERVLAPYLVAYGVATDSFDVVTTPFAADGTGLDAVLAISTFGIGMTSGVIWVDDSAGATETKSESDFGVNTDTGEITVSSHFTTGSGAMRDTLDRITLPLGTHEAGVDGAVAGVERALRDLSLVMSSRGAALKGSDIIGYFAPGYLNEGKDAASDSERIADDNKSVQQTLLGVTRVVSFSGDKGLIAVKFLIRLSAQGFSQLFEVPEQGEEGFLFARQGDGRWKLYGDQRYAHLAASSSMGFDYSLVTTANPDPIAVRQLQVSADAPFGTLAAVSATGDFPPVGYSTEALVSVGNPDEGDTFVRANTSVPFFPAAGSSYDVQVTLAGDGGDYVYATRCSSCGDDGLRLLEYDGVAYAAVLNDPKYHTLDFVHPGTPLTVTWAAPTTFPVTSVRLFARVHGFSVTEEVDTGAPLAPTATSGKLTIPTSVGGQDVVSVDILVQINGRGVGEVHLLDRFGT